MIKPWPTRRAERHWILAGAKSAAAGGFDGQHVARLNLDRGAGAEELHAAVGAGERVAAQCAGCAAGQAVGRVGAAALREDRDFERLRGIRTAAPRRRRRGAGRRRPSRGEWRSRARAPDSGARALRDR